VVKVPRFLVRLIRMFDISFVVLSRITKNEMRCKEIRSGNYK
jgi:hypothetical protein